MDSGVPDVADRKAGHEFEGLGDPGSFFASIISAGAILSGFCGTFLAFRVQREANYYRQPVASFEEGRGRDVYIGLTHFTSAFLLLSLATLGAIGFGLLVPLLALAGNAWALGQTKLVAGGLVGTLALVVAYFLDELVHYRILSSRLVNDALEWGREWWVVAVGLALAIGGATAAYLSLQ